MNQFVPRYVQIVSRLKFDCISSEVYEDNLKMRLGRISIASYRTCSQNFLNCVLADIHLDLLPKVLWQFQNVLQPNLKCIILNKSKICPNCVSAENPLHLVGNPRRQFEIVSESKFNYIASNMFSEFLILRFSHNLIASDWIYSKICPKCFIVETQLLFIEFALMLFRTCVSWSSIASFWKSCQTFPNCVLAETQLHPRENTPKFS